MGGAKNLAQILISSDTSLRDKVLELLKDPANIEYRDNDAALIAHVWYDEVGAEKCNFITAYDFLLEMGQNKLSPANKIVEQKLKLQDQYEDLRGEHYEIKRIKNTKPPRRNKKRLDEEHSKEDTGDDSE